jgi:hypothetical protein
MKHFAIPYMLLIAGTGRNTGKTTLACDILRKFSPAHSIVSLKITPHFHKNIQSGKVIVSRDELYIAEETDAAKSKDSSLMLHAGAKQSYFAMANDHNLSDVWQTISRLIPPGSLVICESGGLRSIAEPGLFFMMRSPGAEPMKPNAEKLIFLADKVITFDGKKTDFDLNSIEITGNRWKLKQRSDDTI